MSLASHNESLHVVEVDRDSVLALVISRGGDCGVRELVRLLPDGAGAGEAATRAMETQVEAILKGLMQDGFLLLHDGKYVLL